MTPTQDPKAVVNKAEDKKYRFNPLFYYYYWKYKRMLLKNPQSKESLDLAQRSGSIRKLWKYIEQRSTSE